MKQLPKLLLVLIVIFLSPKTYSQTQTPSVQWYKDAKFGMFITWGLYAQMANNWEGKKYFGISEWLMNRAKIPAKEYEKLTATFNQ